jgi:hypothetical protein
MSRAARAADRRLAARGVLAAERLPDHLGNLVELVREVAQLVEGWGGDYVHHVTVCFVSRWQLPPAPTQLAPEFVGNNIENAVQSGDVRCQPPDVRSAFAMRAIRVSHSDGSAANTVRTTSVSSTGATAVWCGHRHGPSCSQCPHNATVTTAPGPTRIFTGVECQHGFVDVSGARHHSDRTGGRCGSTMPCRVHSAIRRPRSRGGEFSGADDRYRLSAAGRSGRG